MSFVSKISTSLCIFLVSACIAASGQTNVLTQHNDIGRTGQNTTETILTPTNVSSGNFGKVGALPLDGDAYAQPLYMSSLNIGGVNHSVVFIATEHDSVYAFDAGAGGQQLWKATMLDAAHGAAAGAVPDPESDTGCGNVNGPEYGIMGTPVIDPTTNTMYVVSLTYENNYAVQRLHALDVTTGNEKFGGPTTIAATVAGTGSGSSNGKLSFDPKYNNQRAGLLLVNGIVYIAWASHCDSGPWHGWLMGYNASTMAQSTVFVTTPNGGGSGIWMSGTGLAADVENGVARMFVPTGNGTYDATAPYGTNTMDYGDDILRLNLSNGIQVADAFTPSNQAYLAQNDMDVASGGLIVLPDNLPGSPVAHEAIQMAKSGITTVLNRENLGGYNSTDQSLQQVAATIFTTDGIGGYGLWGAPAYWNNNFYVWPAQSLPSGNLLQYSITNGLLSTSPVAMSTQSDTWQGNQFWGATPSISANGTTNGIVWVDDTGNYNGGVPQYFYALDATNVANTLWSSTTNSARDNAGIEQKYTVPTIADGRVFLMASRQLLVYGLLDFSMTVPSSISVNPGNNTTTAIGLTSSTSFTQGVTFSTSALPSGVTVSFTQPTNGSAIALFTAAASAAPGTSNITITAVRGTTTQTTTAVLTVGGLPDFLLSAGPASVQLGTTGFSSITVTPQNGFTGVPSYVATGLPAGFSASFAGCSAAGCTLLLTASNVITQGTYPVTIQATSGTLVHSISTTVTVSRSGYTNVDLSKFYNINAIATDGNPPGNGGVDGAGYAFSGKLLGTSQSWAGTAFKLGPPDVPDAVAYQTVTLPAGNFVNLQYLASGGGDSSEPIVVTYTDGSTSNFSQIYSNWGYPVGYAGESIAITDAYRVTPNGSTQNGPWYIYGYTLPLSSGKTASSITLPPTGVVVVMAMALSSQSSSVPQMIFFSPIASQQTSPSVPLNATASSGLPVTFSSATPSVCTVSGSTASLLSNGTCTITASQAGNAVYAAATAVSQSFSVALPPQSQSITFAAIATQQVNATVSLSATASSGLPVTFASSTTSICTVSGSTASLIAVGTCTITASQAGNGNYTAATPVSQSFTVNPLYQVPVNLASSYNVNSLVNSGTAPLNGGFDGASYAYAANLLGSTATWAGVQFTLGPANVADSVSSVTIPIPAGSFSSLRMLGAASFGTQTNLPFVLTYSDGTTTTVTQSLSDWGYPANYPGESIAVTTPYRIVPNGTTQSSTWNIYGYTLPVNSAKMLVSITLPNDRNVVVMAMSLTSTSPIWQSITFPAIANQQVNATVSLSATASSGLPVTFASSTTSVCTVSGSTASLIAVGTCTITASQAGNGNYAAAWSASQSFTVNPLYQVPVNLASSYNVNALVNSGTAPSNGGFDGASYAYAANLLGSTATWAGVQFTLGPANVADSASSVTIPLPAGSFSSLRMLGAASFGTQSNLPFVLTYSDGTTTTLTQSLSDWGYPANYSGESIAVTTPYRIVPNGTTQSYPWNIYGYTLPVNSAKTLVSITLPNDRNVVVMAMSLTSTSPIAQSISFSTIATQQVNATVSLSATASSGLPVVFASSTTSVCTVSGSTASLIASGTCTITASQAGNANYAAASTVSQSFTVGLQSQSISFPSISAQTNGTQLTLAATASSGLAVSFASSTTGVCTVSGSTATFASTGTCTITASQAGNGNYAAAASVAQSFTVVAAPTLISLSSYDNVYAIFNNGSAVTNGGIDTSNYAFSGNLLGTSMTWSGTTFALGSPGVADAVSNKTITLPAGKYASLQLLATDAAYGQTNQPFVVTYSDGTTTTFTQSVSNWNPPQGYAGESIAVSEAYRVTPNGSTQNGPWYIYGYSFALNSAKTVSSIKLPPTSGVVVFGMALNPNSTTAQSITFSTVGSQIVGTPLTLTATASSGLAVTYTSTTPAVCTVSGRTATFGSAGTCTLTASQSGNVTYAAATTVVQSFSVTSH